MPVPSVYCDVEDDGAYYLTTEYIRGVGMPKNSDTMNMASRKRGNWPSWQGR